MLGAQVRRELSSALRDIASLVGQGDMLNHLAGLVQLAQQQMQQQQMQQQDRVCPEGASNAFADTPGSTTQAVGPSGVEWTRLECVLYAANIILSRPSALSPSAASVESMAGAESEAEAGLAEAHAFPPVAVCLVVDACVNAVLQHSGALMP